MAVCSGCAIIGSAAIMPFGKWQRLPNNLRWPRPPRGFPKYEFRGGNPRADSLIQALPQVRLAANPAVESHALSFSEVQLPLPDVQHLDEAGERADRKSTRLNSSHSQISYAVFCLKKKSHFILLLMSLSDTA